MALESVAAAESLIPSNAEEENDDLEDGEIPSDEDDEPTVPTVPPVPEQNSSSSSSSKPSESQKDKKDSDSKSSSKNKSKSSSSNNNSSSKSDRFSSKYAKNPSEDWAGDVEKAIKAVLDEDKPKNSDNSSSKSKSKSSSRSKNRKRNRDDREEDRLKEQKKRRVSEDENGNDDDDEMLFVRGASPSRREHDSSPMLPRRSPRRSPLRRSHERDLYDDSSDRDSDDRTSRHRDDKRSNARGTTPRRSQKNSNDRGRGGGGGDGGGGGGGKNKNRGQGRNDRNNSRRNQNDNIQDPESICVYFMQGKCHRGDDCPFSHNASPPRKMELCKFYLMDCCAKREKCLYMHHDFPCKFYHTGLKCLQAANCKFSHEPLNEQVKNILLKHLETAPKEILGDFPRLSREGALLMINNAARHSAQGQEAGGQKIPSLFDVSMQAPANSLGSNKAKDDENSALELARNLSKSKSGGKKTRWGSDDDRAPLDHILLLQQVSQLNLHLPNITLAMQQQIQNRLMIQQCLKDIQNKNMDFYSENVQGSPAEQLFAQALPKLNNEITMRKDDNTDDADKSNKLTDNNSSGLLPNNLDIRAFIAQNTAKNLQFSNLADEAANWAQTKFNEESDKEEDSGLIIEVPVDEDENKEKDEEKSTKTNDEDNDEDNNKKIIANNVSSNEPNGNISEQENPLSHLPTKAQELFLRIQQQQRSMAQDDATKALSAVESAMKDQEEWYSDDSDDDDGRNIIDDDDDDDDEAGNLQIVIKDNHSEKSDQESPQKELPEKSSIPQPAVIVDTLGDLSKIDISAEVTKLLSSIKPQGLLIKKSPNHESSSTTTTMLKNNNNNDDRNNQSSPDHTSSRIKIENDTSSPMNSPSTSSIPVSRDPRMSRDPRQRRLDDSSSTAVKSNSPPRNEIKKETKSLRMETSIYSSGIISMDAGDVDFRTRLDQDHRRQDMDLRQRFQDFGDTDLRLAGNSSGNFDSTLRSDIDLRQMLTLPFKPAPTHVPCTEIDGSLASHSPVTYKVYVVDIPRPNYTGLKLSKNDGAVKYDPRLRKIFRLPKVDIADSPMSPPPVKPDTPKSPPPQSVQPAAPSPSSQLPVRVDPRRKALELASHQVQGGPAQPGEMPMVGLGGLGPMGQNPMMAGMGPNAMLGGMMQSGNMPMNMGPPNGPMMNANQMSFDPMYNNGLLGPAPLGYSDGPNYDGPGYQGGGGGGGGGGGNYGNFGPCQNDNMMGYGPNQMNYGNDWSNGGNNNNNNNNNGNNQGPMRRGGRMRRRNRNKQNLGPGNRGNRSPM